MRKAGHKNFTVLSKLEPVKCSCALTMIPNIIIHVIGIPYRLLISPLPNGTLANTRIDTATLLASRFYDCYYYHLRLFVPNQAIDVFITPPPPPLLRYIQVLDNMPHDKVLLGNDSAKQVHVLEKYALFFGDYFIL